MSDKTRNLRYKRPALASMGAESIMLELDEIVEKCNDIRYYVEAADTDETLLNALDGDEDAEWEFRMAFADLSAKAEELQMRLYEQDLEDFYRDFDDTTVALIGNRYDLVGFDSEEEDYFSLTSYEEGLAQTEAGKRLCRLTKSEMIERIGWAFGIKIEYLEFLRTKENAAVESGFDADDLNPKLFEYEHDIVRWALKKGKAAILRIVG